MGWLILILLPFVLTEAQKYHQNDYTVEVQRVEVVNYNRSYLRNVTCGLVHYNRTFRAINVSVHLLKDLSMHVKISAQLLKFLSNEYRFFPLTMEIDVCKEMARDTFGVVESVQKSVNFPLHCPVKSGFLRMTYGVIDFSHFPPYIPSGEYKDELVVSDNSNFLVTIHFYVKIQEILKKWEH